MRSSRKTSRPRPLVVDAHLIRKLETGQVVCGAGNWPVTKCQYCGSCRANTIDRLESDEGYQQGNVVPACWRCNRMKGTLSLDVFLWHVRAIVKFHRDGTIPDEVSLI